MDERARPISRRALLAAGAVGLVAGACSTGGPGSAPTTSGSPSTPPSSPTSPAISPRRTDWSQLSSRISGTVRRRGDAGYAQARLTEDPRYDDARPLAVVTVESAQDVATTMAFAQEHDLPVAIRSGGHSYPGYSAGGAAGTGVPRSLVIDCRGLDRVSLDGGTATIGAGTALAAVYDALGRRNRAIPGGSCATVGVGGLTQGGGVGVLTRALGLTCDAVTSMTVVTADGRVRTVDDHQDDDLFWALRGGGGGHLGVVTSFAFATTAAPTVTSFYLAWPFADAADVVHAWQAWAPSADARLWSTCKLLGGRKHPTGPAAFVSGTWIGPAGALDQQLRGLLAHLPSPNGRSVTTRDYRSAMASYAGCANVPVARCTTGPGGMLQREAFAATSHIGYTALGSSAISTLIGRVQGAQGTGLHEAGISMDALGGRVREVSPSATAFVHRRALMTVQYTATYGGASGPAAASYVRDFRAAMLPAWGNHAYVNYADAAVPDYKQAYFGANAARLAAAKKTYDPHGFFTQPQGF